MEVIIDNLATALTVAIEQKTEEEKAAGYSGDSSLLAG